ncbi:hypothetical protein JUNP479_1471 [Aeromonas jandaei]|nr:hypothetical protein JUNP479_1471 [Aeromonas jandaei]
MADGGGGDAEFKGGLAETAVAGDGGKHRQFGEIGTGYGHLESTKRRESQGYAKGMLHTIHPEMAICFKSVNYQNSLNPVKLILNVKKNSQQGALSVILVVRKATRIKLWLINSKKRCD